MDIEKYSKIAPQYYNYQVPSLLKKYLIDKKDITILDCGCGDGSLINSLKNNGYLKNNKIFAIDLSRNRIDLVKKISDKVIACVDNVEELNTIFNNSIDLFISSQVIEHVNDVKMIKQIEKKVKTGGIIYISTVFKKWYGWYFYRNNGKWVLDPTHLREYTSSEQLLKLFDKNKFHLLECKINLQKFPVIDFFIKRSGIRNRNLYKNRVMKILRNMKLPIPGYYEWEIVFKKI
jgi:2-polyprenyl-3-methyl-5-hydroxy-6-metoxy-1,4-benzoquinol methylase